MSSSGSSHREGNPLQIRPEWCSHAGVARQTGSPAGHYNHPLCRSSQIFICDRISFVEGQVSGLGTVHPLLTINFFSTWCDVIT